MPRRLSMAISAVLALVPATIHAEVPDDNCANPTPLTFSSNGSYDDPQSTVGATFSGVAACESVPVVDRWFEVIAPVTGVIEVRYTPFAEAGTVALYSSCGTTAIDCATSLGQDMVIVEADVQVGDSLIIRIASTTNLSGGTNASLSIRAVVPPPNQSCASAIGFGFSSVSTVGAELSGVLPSCSPALAGDLWFEYTAASNGLLSVGASLPGPGDAVAAIYDSCANLNEVDCAGIGLGTPAMAALSAGETVYVQILSDPGQASVVDDFQSSNILGNTCGDPFFLVGGQTFALVETEGAVRSALQPTCDDPQAVDRWYAFIAVATEPIEVVLDTNEEKGGVSVFADCMGPELACDYGIYGDVSVVQFDAIAGSTYRVRVASEFADDEMELRLLRASAPIGGETCGTAVSIPGSSVPSILSPVVSSDLSSCEFEPTRERWFQVSVGNSGPARFRADPETTSVRLSVLDACGGNEVVCGVARYGNPLEVDTTLVAGVTYRILVQTSEPDDVDLSLDTNPAARPPTLGRILVGSGTSRTVLEGETFSVDFTLENESTLFVSGWTYAVEHDPSKLRLLSVERGEFEGLLPTGFPGYFEVVREIDNPSGNGAYIVQLANPTGLVGVLPSIDPFVGRATYENLMDPGDSTVLALVHRAIANIPSPPLNLEVRFEGPTFGIFGDGVGTQDLTVETVAGVSFVRGSCMTGGSTPSLAEVIAQLEFIFAGASPPSCYDACDINDDGVISFADPLELLSGLFSGSPRGDGSCEVDSTDDDLPDCTPDPNCT